MWLVARAVDCVVHKTIAERYGGGRMKIKVSEAKDETLNYLVAKAMGVKVYPSKSGRWMTADYGEFNHRHGAPWFCPSESWAQGGPIIEREKMTVESLDTGWLATRIEHPAFSEEQGPTPLVAAMRCYVASKLGDEVEVPDGLN